METLIPALYDNLYLHWWTQIQVHDMFYIKTVISLTHIKQSPSIITHTYLSTHDPIRSANKCYNLKAAPSLLMSACIQYIMYSTFRDTTAPPRQNWTRWGSLFLFTFHPSSSSSTSPTLTANNSRLSSCTHSHYESVWHRTCESWQSQFPGAVVTGVGSTSIASVFILIQVKN